MQGTADNTPEGKRVATNCNCRSLAPLTCWLALGCLLRLLDGERIRRLLLFRRFNAAGGFTRRSNPGRAEAGERVQAGRAQKMTEPCPIRQDRNRNANHWKEISQKYARGTH